MERKYKLRIDYKGERVRVTARLTPEQHEKVIELSKDSNISDWIIEQIEKEWRILNDER